MRASLNWESTPWSSCTAATADRLPATYSPTSTSPWLDADPPHHFFHFVIVIFAPAACDHLYCPFFCLVENAKQRRHFSSTKPSFTSTYCYLHICIFAVLQISRSIQLFALCCKYFFKWFCKISLPTTFGLRDDWDVAFSIWLGFNGADNSNKSDRAQKWGSVIEYSSNMWQPQTHTYSILIHKHKLLSIFMDFDLVWKRRLCRFTTRRYFWVATPHLHWFQSTSTRLTQSKSEKIRLALWLIPFVECN